MQFKQIYALIKHSIFLMAHLPSMKRCKTFKIKKNIPEIIKVTLKLKLLFTDVLRSELVRGHTIIGRRQWQPTQVLSPGKSHGQRSLVGCSPWGRWGSDTTEQLHFHFSLSCIGEGNGNPLQCSCLENPRDRGAWWAAIYGVAQSQTQLKQLSSSRIQLLTKYMETKLRKKQVVRDWRKCSVQSSRSVLSDS